ncbi:hypothetical protein CPC08DRAFT_153472 [Agrocybe pediades]|nr:hypothetical protein CPC08DRAFT_153472 [Agrocybe pediades]
MVAHILGTSIRAGWFSEVCLEPSEQFEITYRLRRNSNSNHERDGFPAPSSFLQMLYFNRRPTASNMYTQHIFDHDRPMYLHPRFPVIWCAVYSYHTWKRNGHLAKVLLIASANASCNISILIGPLNSIPLSLNAKTCLSTFRVLSYGTSNFGGHVFGCATGSCMCASDLDNGRRNFWSFSRTITVEVVF